jgi:hypothetical protein
MRHLIEFALVLSVVTVIGGAAWYGMNRTLCYRMAQGWYTANEIAAMQLNSSECQKYN